MQMKKNILIGLLLLTNVIFATYAYMQKMEARINYERSLESRMHAEKQRMLATENEKLAHMAQMEAMRQRELADQQLQNCLAKK
jgi:hypothetical protein